MCRSTFLVVFEILLIILSLIYRIYVIVSTLLYFHALLNGLRLRLMKRLHGNGNPLRRARQFGACRSTYICNHKSL